MSKCSMGQTRRVPAAYFYCETDELADLVLTWESSGEYGKERFRSLIKSLKEAEQA